MNQPENLAQKKSDASAKAASEAEDTLYAVRQKVYPRAVTGRFATWRWILVWATQLIFYGLCWLPWNGRQAVLLDVVERKFYIFGWCSGPRTCSSWRSCSSSARIRCSSSPRWRGGCGGYACPQTVYTEIFMWIEEKIEGNRSQRMKLDQAPMSARKLGSRRQVRCLGRAVPWTGFTLVGYFTPIRNSSMRP
jgi:polyferredoxin